MAAMLKLACVYLACMVVFAPYPADSAISCGTVQYHMAPCLGYLFGGALQPGCCSGIKALLADAQTTPDHQVICKCLKGAANSVSGVNFANAASLPRKCGVNIPYKISPSIDCTKVR